MQLIQVQIFINTRGYALGFISAKFVDYHYLSVIKLIQLYKLKLVDKKLVSQVIYYAQV